MKKIILLLILATAGFAVYYFYFREENNIDYSTDTYNSINTTELPLISYVVKNKDDTEKKTRLIENIPEVKILSNSIASDEINDYIKRLIEDEENKFIKLSNEDLLKSTIPQNIINSFSISGKTILYTPKILSFRFDTNMTLISSAKPEAHVLYVIFDVEKGKVITFDNLFPNQEVLSAISEYATQNSLNKDEILKSLKENHSFSIDKSGLTVVIDKTEDDKEFEEILIPMNIIDKYIDIGLKDHIISDKEYMRMSEPELN